jgi:hypothetical protein
VRIDEYNRFTGRLVAGLEGDDGVLGIVGLGSTASSGREPDRWSDHDVWIVVRDGEQERFRSHVGWLPDADQIAWWHRETEHGLSVLYRSGHLVECAVFAASELSVARANLAAVLLDRGGVADRIAALQAHTAATIDRPATEWLLGQLLAALVVGVSRWARGERLSGHYRLMDGVRHLVRLLAVHAPPSRPDLLDDLDPVRRIEDAWPATGAELDRIVSLPVPEAAPRVVDLLRAELGSLVAPHGAALAAVTELAATARASSEAGPPDRP